MPAGQPKQDVHVMAALLQDHGGAQARVSPVPTHKRVRLMPVGHLLDGLHRDQLADGAGVEKTLDLLVKGGIAQDVAYHHMPVLRQREALDVPALLLRGGDGLFQEQVVAQPERFHGLAVMRPVRRADEHGVRQAPVAQHFLGAVKALLLGKAVGFAHLFQLFGADVRRGDDAHAVCKLLLAARIGVLAARAAAGDGDGDGLHENKLLSK